MVCASKVEKACVSFSNLPLLMRPLKEVTSTSPEEMDCSSARTPFVWQGRGQNKQ